MSNAILDALAPAPLIGREVTRRAIRRQAAEVRSAYRDGLPAERQSLTAVTAELRRDLRRAWLSEVGRPIDLEALIQQRQSDGTPVWAIVDPALPIGIGNGGVMAFDFSGDRCLGCVVGRKQSWDSQVGAIVGRQANEFARCNRPTNGWLPTAMPPLPPRVRELAMSPRIRARARMVGVLGEMEMVEVIRADPALVVEWRDRPGEYFALAVWGHDGPAIMEFVT